MAPNELGEAIINQPNPLRQKMVADAIKHLAEGVPVSIVTLAPLLPPDFELGADDLEGIEGMVREQPPAPESVGNESATRDKISELRAAKGKPPTVQHDIISLLPHLETREQAQAHLDDCCNRVAGGQGKREALRRKVAVARDAVSKAVGAFQGLYTPEDIYKRNAAEQLEVRRAQVGTHADMIRRRNATLWVQKNMRGSGPRKGGMTIAQAQAANMRADGTVWKTASVEAAPKLKPGQ